MARRLQLLSIWVPLLAPALVQAQTTTRVDSVLVTGLSYARVSVDLFRWEHWDSLDTASATVLGIIERSGPPLRLEDEAPELTYLVSDLNLTSISHWIGNDGESGGLSYGFAGGTIRVLGDESPDADWADPATFSDGDLLLEGQLSEYWFSNCWCAHVPTTHGGLVEFTGGSLFEQVSRDGAGFHGFLDHRLDAGQPFFSPDSTYQFPARGLMSLQIPVPVRQATWGALKQRFSP